MIGAVLGILLGTQSALWPDWDNVPNSLPHVSDFEKYAHEIGNALQRESSNYRMCTHGYIYVFKSKRYMECIDEFRSLGGSHYCSSKIHSELEFNVNLWAAALEFCRVDWKASE